MKTLVITGMFLLTQTLSANHLPNILNALNLVRLPIDEVAKTGTVEIIEDDLGSGDEKYWIYMPVKIDLSSYGPWWEAAYTHTEYDWRENEITLAAVGKKRKAGSSPKPNVLRFQVPRVGKFPLKILQVTGSADYYVAEVTRTSVRFTPQNP